MFCERRLHQKRLMLCGRLRTRRLLLAYQNVDCSVLRLQSDRKPARDTSLRKQRGLGILLKAVKDAIIAPKPPVSGECQLSSKRRNRPLWLSSPAA